VNRVERPGWGVWLAMAVSSMARILERAVACSVGGREDVYSRMSPVGRFIAARISANMYV